MKENTKKKLRKTLIGLGVTVGLFLILHFPIFAGKLKISPETTVIDGPLNPDGTVNYVAALNIQNAAGVTREDNAALVLLEAFGPEALEEPVRQETLRRLENSLTQRADRFVSWDEWFKAKSPAPASAEAAEEESVRDEFDRLVKMLSGGKVSPKLDQWLARNAEALRLITEASARPRFYIPLISEKEPPQLIDTGANQCLRSIRDAAIALGIRARIKGARGDFDSARSDVMTIHRVARLLDQSPTLVRHLVAIGADKAGSDAGVYIATRAGVSSRQAGGFLADISGLQALGQLKERIDRYERFQTLDGLMIAYRSVRTNGWRYYLHGEPFDLNEGLRQLNRDYDRMVSLFAQTATMKWADAKREIDQYEREQEEYMASKRTTSYRAKMVLCRLAGLPFRRIMAREIADLVLCNLAISLSHLVPIEQEHMARMDLEKLTVAMVRYRAENGTWPKALSELCPRYTDAIPEDRFTGEPLIYRPTPRGYLLYSLGANLKDDGGVYDRESGKDDIAAEVK